MGERQHGDGHGQVKDGLYDDSCSRADEGKPDILMLVAL